MPQSSPALPPAASLRSAYDLLGDDKDAALALSSGYGIAGPDRRFRLIPVGPTSDRAEAGLERVVALGLFERLPGDGHDYRLSEYAVTPHFAGPRQPGG